MSSRRYLLDTTVVLALVRGRELGAHVESTYKGQEAATDNRSCTFPV